MSETGEPKRAAAVVVGVDGSAGATEALRWALAEARLRKVPLRIVHAWMFGYMGGAAGGYGYMGSFGQNASLGVDVSDLHRAAEELLEKAIGAIAGEEREVEIERQVVEGSAAGVLLDAVSEGDLLVVGSRGHGGFGGLLLGSVSQQCVHHAPCPVVVVHPSKAAASDRGLADAPRSEG
ncbi:MAG: universal stress protein [Gaiellaceae bacterium]